MGLFSNSVYPRLFLETLKMIRSEGLVSFTLVDFMSFLQEAIRKDTSAKKKFPIATLGANQLHYFILDIDELHKAINLALSLNLLELDDSSLKITSLSFFKRTLFYMKRVKVVQLDESYFSLDQLQNADRLAQEALLKFDDLDG